MTPLSQLNKAELVELLQHSAVEHLTAYRRFVAQDSDIRLITPIVTTDFEALYAYKRGDYQRCLQLSERNVRTLTDAIRGNSNQLDGLPTFVSVMVGIPEITQLVDTELVSLMQHFLGENLLDHSIEQYTNGNPSAADHTARRWHRRISQKYMYTSQLSLSLYLMTQCQIKLHHYSLTQSRYHVILACLLPWQNPFFAIFVDVVNYSTQWILVDPHKLQVILLLMEATAVLFSKL